MKKIYILLFVAFLLSTLELSSAWKKNTSMPLNYQNIVYLDVFFLPSNPQYGWICGYEGKTLRTTDGGKNWLGSQLMKSNNIPLEAQLESIQFLSETVGFTSGPELMDGQGVIYKSTDGGASWFEVTPNNAEDLWGTYFIDQNVGFVIGGGCGSSQFFWRTEDGGRNWSASIYNNPGSKMADLLVDDINGLGYAIGSGTLWRTTNGGKSWLPISTTGNVDWHEEITRVDKTFLIPYSEGCFGNTVTDIGGIRITNDEGKNWFQYSTGVPMFGTFLFDKNRGWAAGFNNTVIYTSDGGKTWSQQNCGIAPGASMDDIRFINDTTGWVVGNGVYEYFIPDANPPSISSTKGFTICRGDSLLLTADSGYDGYIWSTGENSKSIIVKTPGKYSVRGIVDSICYDGMSEFVEVKYFEESNPEFILSSGNSPCEGDTVTISLRGNYLDYEWFDGSVESKIIVTESGEYSVKLIDSNGCTVYASYKVDFSQVPTPEISSKGRLNFCIGDSTIIYTLQAYSKYSWYKSGIDSIISEKSEFWVTESGDYSVVVENASGCRGTSDTISVNVRSESDVLDISLKADNTFDLDSAFFSQLNCRMMNITNKGSKDFVLPDVYIFKNISFSTPQSQFPIIIPSGGSIQLKVCFSPEKLGINLDTLVLSDICNDKLIKLLGFGINESFDDLTKCDVPLEFILTNLNGESYSFGLANATPNPASDNTTIKFSAANANSIADDMDIEILNSIGQRINSNFRILSSMNGSNIVNGEIIINTSDFLSGLYVIVVKLNGEYISGTFTVFR